MASFEPSPGQFATPEQAQAVFDEIKRVLGNVALITPKVKKASPYKGANWQGMSLTWHEAGIVHPEDKGALLLASAQPLGFGARNRYDVEMTLDPNLSSLLLARYAVRPEIFPPRRSPEHESLDQPGLPVESFLADVEGRLDRQDARMAGSHRATPDEAENLLLQLRHMPEVPGDSFGA